MLKSEEVWLKIREESSRVSACEPVLSSFLQEHVQNQKNFADAISLQLSERLDSLELPALVLREIFNDGFTERPDMIESAAYDLEAASERDPSLHNSLITPLLYMKGFHALEAYRFSHWMWEKQRFQMAMYLKSRITEVFHVDIHPAATLGRGIMLDHATGIVIGETSVVGNNVSILQNVTLGYVGDAVEGDRHPKIRDGVIIGPDTVLAGNIVIGEYSQICAGSVVLENVKPHVMVSGVPAIEVGVSDGNLVK